MSPIIKNRHCYHCGVLITLNADYCPTCGTFQFTTAEKRPTQPLVRLPGWYQDPFLRTAYRFWNGSVWTHDAYVKHGSQLFPSLDLLAYPQSSNDPDPTTPLTGSPWTLLAATFAGLGIAFVLSLILVLVDERFGRPGGVAVTLVMSELGLWTGLFATCIVASRTFGSRSLRSDFGFAFRWKDIGIGSLGAIMARFLTAIVAYIVIIFAPRVVSPDASLIRAVDTSSIALLIYCLIVCIGAPFFEELFFADSFRRNSYSALV